MGAISETINPARWAKRPKAANYPAPIVDVGSMVGVTVVSSRYAHMAREAVERFQKMTGLHVVVLHSVAEPAFSAKLNLDLLLAPRRVVFFDVDYWMLRPFDFSTLPADRFSAVPDPGVGSANQFPAKDCARQGWAPETYFNSGLFVCNLAQPEIRQVFSDARARLTGCHTVAFESPADWTDQFFFNWAVQQQPGLFNPLPIALNFYKVAADGGNLAHIPAQIIGLHAAGVSVERKLEALRQQAAVFGPPEK